MNSWSTNLPHRTGTPSGLPRFTSIWLRSCMRAGQSWILYGMHYLSVDLKMENGAYPTTDFSSTNPNFEHFKDSWRSLICWERHTRHLHLPRVTAPISHSPFYGQRLKAKKTCLLKTRHSRSSNRAWKCYITVMPEVSIKCVFWYFYKFSKSYFLAVSSCYNHRIRHINLRVSPPGDILVVRRGYQRVRSSNAVIVTVYCIVS